MAAFVALFRSNISRGSASAGHCPRSSWRGSVSRCRLYLAHRRPRWYERIAVDIWPLCVRPTFLPMPAVVPCPDDSLGQERRICTWNRPLAPIVLRDDGPVENMTPAREPRRLERGALFRCHPTSRSGTQRRRHRWSVEAPRWKVWKVLSCLEILRWAVGVFGALMALPLCSPLW